MKIAVCHPAPDRQTARRGLTLIELLVSVTILTVMILAFSVILTQSQRFVSVSQATRRSYALAATVARIIRSDVRRASQNGFLAVGADAEGNGRLVFSTAGTRYSLVTDTSGSGSIICYGLVMNDLDQAKTILWRPEFIFDDQQNQPGVQTNEDGVSMSSVSLQAMPRDPNGAGLSLRDVASAFVNKSPASRLRVPPRDTDEIEDLWQVLGTNCIDFSVMWTNGTTRDEDPTNPVDDPNAVKWYGVDPAAPQQKIVPCNDPDIEYQGQGAYLALWTHENQANWPRAIKIRFKFTSDDQDMPRAFREGLEYEVICNIGD